MPVPAFAGLAAPEIELQLALAGGASLVGPKTNPIRSRRTERVFTNHPVSTWSIQIMQRIERAVIWVGIAPEPSSARNLSAQMVQPSDFGVWDSLASHGIDSSGAMAPDG